MLKQIPVGYPADSFNRTVPDRTQTLMLARQSCHASTKYYDDRRLAFQKCRTFGIAKSEQYCSPFSFALNFALMSADE
jgi:hypothetical protein